MCLYHVEQLRSRCPANEVWLQQTVLQQRLQARDIVGMVGYGEAPY